MDLLAGVVIFILAFVAGIALTRWSKDAKRKPGRKDRSGWMTRHQLEVLDSIQKHGRRGVPLWFTDLALSTIRSLSKRGFVDTRRRGRVVATRAGKRRLSRPWPGVQPTGDQKDRSDAGGSAQSEIACVASDAHGHGEVSNL